MQNMIDIFKFYVLVNPKCNQSSSENPDWYLVNTILSWYWHTLFIQHRIYFKFLRKTSITLSTEEELKSSCNYSNPRTWIQREPSVIEKKRPSLAIQFYNTSEPYKCWFTYHARAIRVQNRRQNI